MIQPWLERRSAAELSREELESLLEAVFLTRRKTKQKQKRPGALVEICFAIYDEMVNSGQEWIELNVLARRVFGDGREGKPEDAVRKRIERASGELRAYFSVVRTRKLGYRLIVEDEVGKGIDIGTTQRKARYRIKYERLSHSTAPTVPLPAAPATAHGIEGLELSQHLGAAAEELGSASRFYIPHASLGDRFVGREDDLRAIEEDLRASGQVAVSTGGLAGVGKTQLAAEYAHRKRTDYPGGCFWIEAETGNSGTAALTSSVANLRVPLGLYSNPAQDSDDAERVIDYLCAESRRSLIIFDNADDWRAIREWTHRLTAHHVIITTRDPEFVPGGGLRTRWLGVLESEPALQLLLSCCDESRRPRPSEASNEHKAALQIADRLGGLPLALEIASAYLRSWPEISFEEYDERLVSEGLIDTLEAGDFESTHSRHISSVRATLAPAWKNVTKDSAACRVMACAAFFAPVPIHRDLLATAACLSTQRESPGKPSPFEHTLKRLSRAALLEEGEILVDTEYKGEVLRDMPIGGIICHRLIRDFVRSVLTTEEQRTACKGIGESMLAFLSAYHESDSHPLQSLAQQGMLALHIREIVPSWERLGLNEYVGR